MDKKRFEDVRKNLTRTQKQVFELFLKAECDASIAVIMNDIDVSVVSKHITNITKRFGIEKEKDEQCKIIDKKAHRCELLKLCLAYIPDEVSKPNPYDDSFSYGISVNNNNRNPTPSIQIATDHNQELTPLEFIRRDRDLTNLANLSKQYKIVLIKNGPGGGKSTLAKEFLKMHFQEPNIIEIDLALPVEDNVPASERLPNILKQLNQEISNSFALDLDCLKKRLSDRQKPPVAFLIDNLEPALDSNCRFLEKLNNYEALLGVLGDSNVRSFTLITSRRSLITERGTIRHLPLNGLDIKAWQQYFHDCNNVETSEALIQMHDAYNGNAKIMNILHNEIKNGLNGNIEIYWSRYKDKLLANKEIETLISAEINWLRDNQPDVYKLFYQIGSPLSQNGKLMSFDGLLKLLQDIPESRRSSAIDFLVARTSLITKKDADSYYLPPVLHEAAKVHWLRNSSVLGKLDDESNAIIDIYKAGKLASINSQTQIDTQQGLHNDFNHYAPTHINEDFVQEIHSIKSSDLISGSIQLPSFFTSVFPMSGDYKISVSNIGIQQEELFGVPTTTTPLEHINQNNIMGSTTMNSQLPSILSPQTYFG